MTRSDTIVDFDTVHHAFGSHVVVERFNFKIHRGERVAILGRTGAGKSTILNLLVGNFAPTSGTVRVDGIDPYAQHKSLRGVIGMAYQAPRLLPWRTAVGNVAVGQEIAGVDKATREAHARAWLDKMHLQDSYDLTPSQLSGGMRQRVSLARAFAVDPALVLLDESFSALDEVTARVLRDDFIKVADEEQKTAMIVTHNIEEAFQMAHRVILLGRPARILAEYHTAQEPKVGTTEFTHLREKIRALMLSPEGGISAYD